MGLSAEQQDVLRARYEAWGLDGVRQELERNDRDPLLPAEVAAFARDWVAAEEARLRRMMRVIARLVVAAALLFAASFAAVLVF